MKQPSHSSQENPGNVPALEDLTTYENSPQSLVPRPAAPTLPEILFEMKIGSHPRPTKLGTLGYGPGL